MTALAVKRAVSTVDRLGEVRDQIAILKDEEDGLKGQLERIMAPPRGSLKPSLLGNRYSVTRYTGVRPGQLDEDLVARALGVSVGDLAIYRKPDTEFVGFRTTRNRE